MPSLSQHTLSYLKFVVLLLLTFTLVSIRLNHRDYLILHQPMVSLILLCKSLRNVVASAAEAETACTFYASQNAIPMRRILEALGHKKPPDGTPFKMDDKLVMALLNRILK